MLSAKTVDELFESTKGWGLIDHNLVAADTKGRIGHLVRANAPDRPSSNGWLPVPGWTGENDWKGMIPWEKMPRTFDPTRGYIVTANNRIVSDHRDGDPYLCTDCHPPYRAKRIETLLEALPSATMEDMKVIHGDVQSLTAPVFQNMLRKTTVSDSVAVDMKHLILNWDGKMDKDSISAGAYSLFRWQLAALLAERSGLIKANQHALLQLPPAVVPVHQLWWALPQFVRANDISLLHGWTWEQAFEEALKRTATLFNGKAWGSIHQAALKHPLGTLSADASALLDPPGLFVGGDNDTVLANGCIPAFGLTAAYGAVARYVFDVGNWDACQWIVIDGSSGNHDDAHRMDQHALWAECEMVPMLYNWKLIESKGQCTKLEPNQ
jgi:penicillin amidase